MAILYMEGKAKITRNYLRDPGFAFLQEHLRIRPEFLSLPRTLKLRFRDICGFSEEQQLNISFPQKDR